jgi:hypothetical protein
LEVAVCWDHTYRRPSIAIFRTRVFGRVRLAFHGPTRRDWRSSWSARWRRLRRPSAVNTHGLCFGAPAREPSTVRAQHWNPNGGHGLDYSRCSAVALPNRTASFYGGNLSQPFTERAQPHPTSEYGAHKLRMEEALLNWT